MSDSPVNRVLDAFELAIVEHGVAGASFARIAAIGGFHRSLVQHHFRSREGLVEASLDRTLAYYAWRTVEVRAGSEQPLQALLDWMLSPFGPERPPRVARVVDAWQALAGEPLVRDKLAQLYGGFHAALLEELEAAWPGLHEPEQLAWSLVALSFGRAGLDTLGLQARDTRQAADSLIAASRSRGS